MTTWLLLRLNLQSFLYQRLSLESEWWQVFFSHQDSSQYSGRSLQCCCLDGLGLLCDFQLFQSSLLSLWGPFQVYQFQLVSPSPSCSVAFFSYQVRSEYLSLFLRFSLCVPSEQQSPQFSRLSFFSFFLVNYHYFTLVRVFHISVSRWFITGVLVTASLLKSSGLSSVFWLICILGGLHSSSNFQLHKSRNQSFGDCTKSTNYNFNHRHSHVPQFFFNSSVRSRY